jgi:hypothetical protein
MPLSTSDFYAAAVSMHFKSLAFLDSSSPSGWWVIAHTLTTFPIIFSIHVTLSADKAEYQPRSMNRASIDALVDSGRKHLLAIHLVIIFWVTGSWMYAAWWICRGTFRYREAHITRAAERSASEAEVEKDSQYYPHPHPQYPFQALPSLDHDGWNRGLRLRTVMVTNLPIQLRSDKELKEYFEYYLSRPIAVPALGLTATTQPGFFNKIAAFILNRAKRSGRKLPPLLFPRLSTVKDSALAEELGANKDEDVEDTKLPQVEKVVIVRKMTELASLLERREDVLVRLETAHIKLARKALEATQELMQQRHRPPTGHHSSSIFLSKMVGKAPGIRVQEPSDRRQASEHEPEDRADLLIRTLGPYVEEFGLSELEGQSSLIRKYVSTRHRRDMSEDSEAGIRADSSPSSELGKTVWDALLSLPRSVLDEYQPLIHLNALFRGKTVPAIDYHTAKLNLLNSLILENRARPATDFESVSTAFVTFKDPEDARKACKYLAVHPKSPLSCLTTMAPSYEDLDWTRVMKSSYQAEVCLYLVVDVPSAKYSHSLSRTGLSVLEFGESE